MDKVIGCTENTKLRQGGCDGEKGRKEFCFGKTGLAVILFSAYTVKA